MIRKGGLIAVNPFGKSWKQKMSTTPTAPIQFGPFEVTSQVFLTTPHSFALVNLKPLLPGHVLICPQKPHKRLTDLSTPELTDLFQAVQRVQRMLARHFFAGGASDRASSSAPANTTEDSSATTPSDKDGKTQPSPATGTPEAGSFNIAIQDGIEAGQTVPHVHVHVIPRIRNLTEKSEGLGDYLYEKMAAEEGNVGGALWDREQVRPTPGGAFARIEDAERKPRSLEEMEEEAKMFRGLLEEMDQDGKGGAEGGVVQV
ncbi:HIT-like domain-containing protein [Pseudomassariella vexata]|uniref:Bis(5'-adenosyl)-triphosphatase n=1 Tax=Pseudomassariella vexata TaxID=1141098 RepID=A0A1Y2E1G9_9PEZI|nr:HIT-like domain-containing protein [Pseudomassariella vexata]ORY65194.1 HIT-like domain-containing protein [Pseudomassariella vexata]